MSAATDRLTSGHYNSLPQSVANPGGMDNGGHVENFPAALVDVGTAAVEMIADNAATKAAIEADNDATLSAVNAANTAAVEAMTDLSDAATAAKLAAQAAEVAATNKANEAVATATSALRLMLANFPDRLDATGSAFTEALVGDPSAVASPAGAKIVNAAGYGLLYQAAGAATLAHKGVITAGPEYVIEIAVEIEQTVVGAGETPAARIRLQGLDKDYASTGAAATGPLVVTPAGVTTITRRFAYVAPTGGTAWPQAGVAIWLRPAVDINRKSDDSGAAAGSTARVRRMSIRDVTATVASETAAAAAAASAAAITFSTQAEAEAGTAPGTVMSPLQVAQAIAYQALAVGAVIKAVTAPGARFLACDGASYLKTSYPALAAAIGDRFASYTATTPTPKAGLTTLGMLVEPAFAIATGLNGHIQTSVDAQTWTERAANTANFSNGLGAIKIAASYLVYGRHATSTNRSLVSSANGTTGWADVAAFGTFNNGQGCISSMAYGVINGAATVVAVGGAAGASAQIRFSTDEGANWANLSSWGAGPTTDPDSPKAMIANGVLGLFCPSPASFQRATTMASYAAVTGLPAAPASVEVGAGLFVCLMATGEVYTSPDLLTFTLREPPPGTPTFTGYLGHFNGAHHFKATVGARVQFFATEDFTGWRRVTMPQALGSITAPLRPIAGKFAAPTGAITTVLASFAHNAATEFPVPLLAGDLQSYIKAL
ncbi:tail fiber protein [Caulobacter sp. SL161]|uniref:tail fiber protein n=1 Tax=Caulobacter sp. SL161 TaxID=2995156 RepID=UPI002273A5BD|nr:tail fiber protein [Caulobacter sp. SL161]MCY1648189.1 tail fiber protein [Caulobacter sp. SL161]